MTKTALVAVGGNSLITHKDHPDVPHQWDAVRETCRHLADMVVAGWRLVITHGNGPQVGYILRRNELAAHEVHTTPLDLIVADTQGAIGYMLQQALRNELRQSRGQDTPGVSVEDAGRGWRRVVASPRPLEVIEEGSVRALLAANNVVVAAGGGGIPVVYNTSGELRQLQGIYAVIDKDLASGLLARQLGADLLLISTGVPQIAINFNTPQQQNLSEVTVDTLEGYLREGHFAPGSMKPKVEAAIAFVRAAGKPALITMPSEIGKALAHESGTWIVPA